VKEYPQKYESWWLDRASARFAGTAGSHVLQKLESTVGKLSDQFTLHRDQGAPENYDSPEQILAYGLFFFPQTYGRTRWVVDELLERVKWNPAEARREHPLRVLDLGCGSGAASFALLEALNEKCPGMVVEHYGVDRSGLNLDAARELSEMLSFENITVTSEWLRRDVTSPQFSWENKPFNQPWDVILMSFSFGEFVVDLEDEQAVAVMTDLADALQPSGVAIITEPALMETAVRLEVVRDAIAESDQLQILAPCLHQQACPALARKTFWCHEVRKWRPPESLAYLNTRLHRDIRFLKFSMLVFEKSETPADTTVADHAFRLVSPVAKKSGQLVCKGCAASGTINTYEWLTRHLSKNQVKHQLDLERGDCVTEEHIRALGTPGRFRVGD
jgi:ribosomal protein RSM22 (predicted rRNA methylase)